MPLTSEIFCKKCGKKEKHRTYALCHSCQKEHRRAVWSKNTDAINAARRNRYATDDEYRLRTIAGVMKHIKANKEKVYSRNKRWQNNNKEKLDLYMRRYRHSDMPGAVNRRNNQAAAVRKSRAKHIDKRRAESRGKESLRRSKQNTGFVPKVEQMRFDCDDLCDVCGLPMMGFRVEIDHIIPLSRGGEHQPWNVRLIHEVCNRTKLARLDEEIPNMLILRAKEKIYRTLEAHGMNFRPPNWPMI